MESHCKSSSLSKSVPCQSPSFPRQRNRPQPGLLGLLRDLLSYLLFIFCRLRRPIPSLRLDALRISSVKKGRKAKEDFCTSCLYAALPYCSGASQAATMGKGGTKCAALHLPFFLSIGIYGCRVFRSPARFVGLSVQHRKGGHERSLSAAEMRMQMSEFQRTGAYK